MDASIGKKRKTRKQSAPQPDEDHPSAIMETGAGMRCFPSQGL